MAMTASPGFSRPRFSRWQGRPWNLSRAPCAAGSVEDRVHELLSECFENIANLFGQIPDILEDLRIDLALREVDAAKKTIDAAPKQHPFPTCCCCGLPAAEPRRSVPLTARPH